ncbi:MAG TPA: phosphoribosyltransferase family protein [bacterium]|nr:phosphoribosyltransferase family protein [bacterium]
MKIVPALLSYVGFHMPHILPYNGQTTYDLKIAGTVRPLPLIQVAPDTWIAYYYSLGDTEVIDRAARELAPKLSNCELFVTTETKGIPLAHAIAANLGLRPYVVCRKEIRPFMLSPLVVRYKPITAKTEQELYLDGRDAMKVRGKRVGIIDDIVSTGETLDAMAELVRQAGGTVVARAALLMEGDERADVHHLGILPIFKSKSPA